MAWFFIALVALVLMAMMLDGAAWPTRVHVAYHRRYYDHEVVERRVSAPGFDPTARGVLYRCLDCPDWTRAL